MQPRKLGATEPAVVQRRGQQDTRRAGPGQRGQIAGMAHTARGIETAGRIQLPQLYEACQIGPRLHPHTRQGHDDHLRRPAFRVLQKRVGTEKIVSPEIQRQDALRGPCPAFRKGRQALAAQHRPSPACCLRGLSRRRTGKSPVHPELELRMRSLQCLHDLSMMAPLQDGVQIGNIDSPEGIQRKQPMQHRRGAAGIAQRRLQRPIVVALAGPGTHHLPVHQIENRNKV